MPYITSMFMPRSAADRCRCPGIPSISPSSRRWKGVHVTDGAI
ncbi:hypothetical protein BcanWU425_04990 [Bradyrhizobium sp. WU425]|jgi:hypothetical protein|nr:MULTISPECIES: hypothetical protein [unclassified Bradyrhizobium]UFW73118.1 hypothetical protein BcanWU425_04990 [Bradyrhizobium canariense]